MKAWAEGRTRLTAAGVDSPAIDARLLLEAAAGVSRTDIVADPYRLLAPEDVESYFAHLERRARREPVARILGRKGFWKLLLSVSPAVLTPRPDTETLVEAALARLPQTSRAAILDLGVGSGAILLSILAERPGVRGLGIDISEEALAVARENAANLGLADRAALLRGDWTAGLGDAGFEGVLANPPYIPSGEIETLDPEVRDHEPRVALDGGPDGLEAYRRLAPEIWRVLKPGGFALVEIGWDQGPRAADLFRAAGFVAVEVLKDLGGRDRVVAARKKDLGNRVPTR